MAKFYIKIASIILLFVGCAVAGFFIMPGSEAETGVGGPVIVTTNEDNDDKEVITPNPGEEIDEEEKADKAEQEDEPPIDLPVVEPAPEMVSSQPEIESVEFPPFHYWKVTKSNHHKIGYKVTVKAKTESEDILQYDIITSSGNKYSSANGVFADVYPTNDGKFTVVVTNTRTGEQAKMEKGGLVKNPKLTAQKMETQLSNGVSDRMFYFYFASDVKFRCYGSAISAGSTPKTLQELVNIASMGWAIDVKDATVKYNEWNRITYFEIELN